MKKFPLNLSRQWRGVKKEGQEVGSNHGNESFEDPYEVQQLINQLEPDQ